MLDFDGQLVDGRIFGREPGQRDTEFERGLKIRRTLPASIGKREVEHSHRPRRLDQRLHLGEESRRQRGDWIAVFRWSLEQPPEQARLQRGHAHALAIDGIEAADCVGDGQKPAWEVVKLLEMTPHALGEAVARDPVQAVGAADRVVDRRRPKCLGISQESLRIARRHVTMAPADGCHPAIALERQHQATAAVLGRLAEGHNAFPIGRGVVRDGKDACGIAEIDANCGLLGQRSADRLQQSEREGAASGSIDDEIRRNRLVRAVAVLVAHAGDRLSIWRRQHFLHPAALAQRDIRAAFHPQSHGALDGRP